MPINASTRSACNEDDTRERYGYTMSPSGCVASTALWMQQALVAMAVAANDTCFRQKPQKLTV